MLTIVIPTYNERENLSLLIDQIAAALDGTCDYELLFVDDSVDDTPKILEEISSENPKVRYIHRVGETGLASAVVCGFNNARGDVLAVMDADLQHPPELLTQMYALIAEGADVVLPSRYIGGGESEGLGPVRTIFSKGARLVGKIFLKSMRKISDPMSGFFMIRKSVIDGVALRPIGWKILVEVLALGHYKTVVEIPYGFVKRHAGESKLSVKVTLQYVAHILSLSLRSERDRRVYMLALLMLLGALADMLAFFALHSWLRMPLHLAATLSACVAMGMHYLLGRNRVWKREKTGRGRSGLLRYALVCALGIGAKNASVFLASRAGMAGVWSNLIGLVCAFVLGYLFFDRRVFLRAEESDITYSIAPPAQEKPLGGNRV